MSLSIAAIKDENADGKFDRLDPALDFVIFQMSQTNGVTTIGWNAGPRKNISAGALRSVRRSMV